MTGCFIFDPWAAWDKIAETPLSQESQAGRGEWASSKMAGLSGRVCGSHCVETEISTGEHLQTQSDSDVSQVSRESRNPFAELTWLELDQFEERAAILEFDAGFSRWEAERRALLELLH